MKILFADTAVHGEKCENCRPINYYYYYYYSSANGFRNSRIASKLCANANENRRVGRGETQAKILHRATVTTTTTTVVLRCAFVSELNVCALVPCNLHFSSYFFIHYDVMFNILFLFAIISSQCTRK